MVSSPWLLHLAADGTSPGYAAVAMPQHQATTPGVRSLCQTVSAMSTATPLVLCHWYCTMPRECCTLHQAASAMPSHGTCSPVGSVLAA